MPDIAGALSCPLWSRNFCGLRILFSGADFMKTLTIALVVLALAATIALAQNATQPGPAAAGPTRETGEATKTPSGLQYWDIKFGTGPEAQNGNRIKIHYNSC